jgi:hypothetical protein
VRHTTEQLLQKLVPASHSTAITAHIGAWAEAHAEKDQRIRLRLALTL